MNITTKKHLFLDIDGVLNSFDDYKVSGKEFLENIENNFLGGTLWGEFNISYDKINGGVRFTLLDCPNALSWTITTGFPPERNKIIIHCTINRTQKPKEFIEEIDEFLDEWEAGLNSQF